VIRAIVVIFRLSTELIVALAKNGCVFCFLPPCFALLARSLSEESVLRCTLLHRLLHRRSVAMLHTRQLAGGRNHGQIFHISILVLDAP